MTRILFLDVDGTMIGERAAALPLNRAARGLQAGDPPPVFDPEADRLRLRRHDVWRGALRLDVSLDGAAAILWRYVERRSVEICCACGAGGARIRTEREEWPTLCDACDGLDAAELAERVRPATGESK